MARRAIILTVCLLLVGVFGAQAQETVYQGTLNSVNEFLDFTVTLNAGDSILVQAEAISGNLDTVATLFDPNGVRVVQNDDRSHDSLDSALGYTAQQSGTYTVRVSRYWDSNTSGDFILTLTVGGPEVLALLEDVTRVELTGPVRTVDTAHFRIHYTLEGHDATTELMVNALARSVEEIWRIQIERMGWPPPPNDGLRGGNSLYDVYMADLIGQGEEALGVTVPEDMVGDNPATEGIVENGSTSYIVLENDFDVDLLDLEGAIALMRSTMSHEFNHAIQFGYEVDDMAWYYEATATWMETRALAKDEDATRYVEYVFKYPELCFGSTGDETDGLYVYGTWLFIQALADRHGVDAVQRLWENIATFSGFEALERTLALYGDDLQSMLPTYHLQNLVRQYTLAPVFNVTVWREDTINAPGRWTYTGNGIQELGANYFELSLPAGVYYAGLVNDGGLLNLWALGVNGSQADMFKLDRGGTIDTTAYEHVYLMVFNPLYDDSIGLCDYYDYSIEVTTSKGAATPLFGQWDAANFEPLR